jgi:mediator of RNA polymerase II transcription subunit 10
MESEQQAQGAPASVPSPAMAMEDTLASVQRSLVLLHQLHCSVSTFTMPSQLLLLERLNGLASELEVMHKAAENCHVQIPLEVVSFIDEGRNPDEYTRNLLNSCVQRNQVSRGKVDAFKALRKHLLEEAEDAFPDEIEAYRGIRNQSSAEARRLLQSSDALSNGNLKVKSEH